MISFDLACCYNSPLKSYRTIDRTRLTSKSYSTLEAPGQQTQSQTKEFTFIQLKIIIYLTAVRKYVKPKVRDADSKLRSTGDFLYNLRRAIS